MDVFVHAYHTALEAVACYRPVANWEFLCYAQLQT